MIPLASSVAGNAHLVMTALSKGAMAAMSPLQICMLRGLVDTVMASYDSVNNRAATLTSPVVLNVDTPTQQVCSIATFLAECERTLMIPGNFFHAT